MLINTNKTKEMVIYFGKQWCRDDIPPLCINSRNIERVEWQTALDQGGAVRALLVDFKKAFDSVDHNLLLEKLYNKNVPHQLIKWLFSYLQQRSQRVRVGTHHSCWLHLNGGMPQGSWLGPLCYFGTD